MIIFTPNAVDVLRYNNITFLKINICNKRLSLQKYIYKCIKFKNMFCRTFGL